MIQEMILILGCVKGACESTRYTYLSYNPEVKQYISAMENNAKKYMPGQFQEVVPILVAGYNKEFRLPLSKNITISYKDETVSTKLVYGLDY